MHVFWGMKKLVQLKFVQLLLLNRVKARWSKNRAAQGFYYINSFSSNILDPIQKRAPARSMQLEAVYLEALLYTQSMRDWKVRCMKTKIQLHESFGPVVSPEQMAKNDMTLDFV